MKVASTIFAALTLFAAVGQARETTTTDEFVTIDSRPLSPKTRQLMERQREAEDKQLDEADEAQAELAGLIIPIKTHHLVAFASNHLNTTATSYSPYMYHWIDQFPQENVLKMEDGTEWMFDHEDISMVRAWRPGDTIVVSPRYRMPWSSSHTYIVTNKDLGEAINVNPFHGPVAFGPNTTWVATVDHNAGQIYLYNGQGERTVWEVSNTDLYLLKEWQNNDTVIIGENDHFLWWFSSYNHILVNVNMDHNIRVRAISGPGIRG